MAQIYLAGAANATNLDAALAVKMIYAVVANLMLRFYSPESFQLRFWHQVRTYSR